MKKPELNITPFVDIMLVLLAILMVSVSLTVFQEKSVVLPKGSHTTPATQKAEIDVVITANGEVFVNKEPFHLENFEEEFNLKYGNWDKNALVYIAADKRINYATFMKVYSAIVKNGFTQIGLLTQ
ncbi:MAG: biopolymer transporter ExbD [Campylobacterales bacterium]